MSENKPTAEEWKKLYAAAAKVKEMAPWEWMMEDEVFGVQNPETDEIGFVSVMGAGGKHFAISVYPGAEALYDFLTLHNERYVSNEHHPASDRRPHGNDVPIARPIG